jgi:hypothetical protein
MPYDPKSPLTQILWTKRWPPAYDGNIDPRQFIMSYKAVVTAASGDEATMAMSFVIIAQDIAQSWYAKLCPGSIKSWGDLRDKLCSNSKVLNIAPNHQMDLFNCKHGERERERIALGLLRRFIQLRPRTPKHNR